MDTALNIVIFNSEYQVIGRLRMRNDSLSIDRLDGEDIHNSRVDAFRCEDLLSIHRCGEGDTTTNKEDLIRIGRAMYLRLTKVKHFAVAIDNLLRGTRRADVDNTVVVRSKFNRSFSGYSIGRVEHD